MLALIPSVVSLLSTVAPLLSGASSISAVVQTLIPLIPAVTQTATDLIPAVKGIIASVSANPATTVEQLATLQALDASCDAAFDAAAKAAGV
jgi:hypothetical protein